MKLTVNPCGSDNEIHIPEKLKLQNASTVAYVFAKSVSRWNEGLKMNTQLAMLKLTLCGALISGCTTMLPIQPNTIPLFSHSNPQRDVQPGAVLAYRVQPTVVYFANDSHEISLDAKEKLSRFFNQFPGTNWQLIVIEGHTDSNHDEDYNMKLAKRRTHSVWTVLTELGYPGDHIIEIPKGESQPIASNATAFNRQLNRRVEIQIN